MSDQSTTPKTQKRTVLRGRVVFVGMDKTCAVEVKSFKTHSKYLKKYRSTKKYIIHDPQKKAHEGDFVQFALSRPISGKKKYELM